MNAPSRPRLRTALGCAAITVLVWATVGGWAALGAGALLVYDRVFAPDRRFLATATVILLMAIPVVWLLGSSIPLDSPSTRLQDNTAAHQLGGLAIWMLCVAAWLDISPLEREQR
ncbi:hypothetical protein V6K52_09605 [Knoellia sp. S7-12]|uniref:hypothetical protein n=1 Tax=Knoellia sp. S7-12 TaxID=3126698 RepID=UPI0033687E82